MQAREQIVRTDEQRFTVRIAAVQRHAAHRPPVAHNGRAPGAGTAVQSQYPHNRPPFFSCWFLFRAGPLAVFMDPPELICRETGVVRPRPVRPVPKGSLPAPRFFLCQRMAHPPRPRPRLSRTGLPPSGPRVLRVLRALRVCDCAVRARPAHPRAAARVCACPAPACRALPARYCGRRPSRAPACRGPARAIRWPPSVLRSACRRPALVSFAPCASVTVPSAPGPRTLVPPPAPALVPHRLTAPGPRATVAAVRVAPGLPRPCPCGPPIHVPVFPAALCRLPSPSLGLVLAAAASCPCIRSCRPNCGLFLFRKNLPPRPACGPVQQAAGERAHASVPGAFHARNNIRCKRMGHVYAAGTIRRKW